jgi:nucleoside-diphosphate-sugar epimerase
MASDEQKRSKQVILVSGGAGVMGSRLVKGLVKAGNRVRVLTLPGDRHIRRLEKTDCEIVFADVADAKTLEGVFQGVATVYHLAAVIIAHDQDTFRKINVGGTQNMVQGSVSSGVEHFIYISSASVIFPNASAYARSKMEGERIVKSQKEMRYTIVRPTLVYEREGGQEFMMFMDYLRKYPFVPFVGRGRAKKNPVFADDVVKGLLAITQNLETYGKIYNFSGGEVVTIGELARLMLDELGLSKPFIPVPIWLCKMIALVLEKTMKNPPLTRYAISRIEQDADLDNTEARIDLGYNPIGVTEGLKRCYPLLK